MNKVETQRKAQEDAIRESCGAGIDGVLANKLVADALVLLDEVAAEITGSDEGPLTFVKNQCLRSVGSIAANLAEGIGVAQPRNRRKFFLTARGSAYESCIWLRALSKGARFDECVSLCREIDAAILVSLASDGSEPSEETETS